MRVPPGVAAGDLVYRTPPDRQFVAAQGVWLTDVEGRRYLDAEASNGAAALGYDSTIVTEAAAAAAVMPALPSFCESETRVRVLQRLTSLFDDVVGVAGRVSVELGGAQGIEAAMRIVAAHRGAGPILVFQGGYHGRSPFTSHLSASARYRAAQPWPGPEVVRLPYPDCDSCPFRPSEGGCNHACTRAVRRFGVDDAYGVPAADSSRPVAALVIEPLLNVGGFVLPDPGHLRAVVEHARSLGALIVVDEIFTGLHRLGPRWGFQLHGIEPDIVVASKALTNGVTPLSVVWAREPLSDPVHFPPGSHSSTFAGNPLALAVVDEVLDRWQALGDPEQRVAQLSEDLRTHLEPLQTHDLVRSVRVQGGLVRIQLAGPHAFQVRLACAEPDDDTPGAGIDLSPGLLLASTGMSPDVVALHPPLVCTGEEVALIASLLHHALERVAAELAHPTEER